MKKIFFIILTTLSLTTYGQDKHNYVHFNKLTEVVGTEFVVASIDNYGKMFESKSRYLLFIDTKTGETNQVDFPKDAGILAIEQIKIDSLDLNLILVSARTVDLSNNKKLT